MMIHYACKASPGFYPSTQLVPRFRYSCSYAGITLIVNLFLSIFSFLSPPVQIYSDFAVVGSRFAVARLQVDSNTTGSKKKSGRTVGIEPPVQFLKSNLIVLFRFFSFIRHPVRVQHCIDFIILLMILNNGTSLERAWS